MRVGASADNLALQSSSAAHTSGVGHGEMGDEDIAEMSVDLINEDLHGKKVSASLFWLAKVQN